MTGAGSLRLRRWGSAALVAVVLVVLVRFGGHAGVHAARSMLVPGGGLVDHHPWFAAAFVAAGIAATVLWLRWGADWLVIAVVVAAMVTSAALANEDHGHELSVGMPVQLQSHEFPLVVLVVAALGWLRSVLGRTPGVRRLVGRRHRRLQGLGDLGALPPVDRCRAAAVLALAGAADAATTAAVTSADVDARCRRVGAVARFRFGGDPTRRDAAHVRAARLLTGALNDDGVRRLANDSARARLGVPCSEPGWARPLDATLVAIALRTKGHANAAAAWTRALDGPLHLRRGHRPAWWWTPLGIGAASMPAWEHAASTAVARAAGLLHHDDDWAALRARALGASARGGEQPDDERMIAASRVWRALADDPEARRIVSRPGVLRDPLACALDRLATQLRDPSWLRGWPAAPSPPTAAPRSTA